MREDILIKHLKNLTLENNKIKDAFIIGVDGLLIAVIGEKEDNQKIAARMAGVMDSAKRIEDRLPDALSVMTRDGKIIALPLSEKFLIVVIAAKDINSYNVIKLIDKNKQNILSMIEKREFGDLFSFSPAEVEGLDI